MSTISLDRVRIVSSRKTNPDRDIYSRCNTPENTADTDDTGTPLRRVMDRSTVLHKRAAAAAAVAGPVLVSVPVTASVPASVRMWPLPLRQPSRESANHQGMITF